LSEAEAMRHPRRNEVYRDVGSEEHAPGDTDFIELQRIPFESDSALLLCSDGLSDLVGSKQIQQAVERHAGDPGRAVEELIGAANDAGGKDNVTVVVVEGENFAASAAATRSAAGGGHAFGRALWFVAGLALAAAGAWFSRSLWVPKPVVEHARVLAVGRGAAYPSIAAALEGARAGDTIDVAAGEYNEQVHLASGVTVRSHVPRAAILRAAPLANGPAVIAENVQDARLSGFRILAAKDMPIATGILLENSNVEVDDVEVDGAGVGVEIRGTANPVLRANAIHDCSNEGVLILGASEPWISHNDIRRNKGAGLAARDGARPAMVGNVFEKNAVEVPEDMKPTVVERNTFLDSGAAAKKAAPRKKE
jgi:hypothetical protein